MNYYIHYEVLLIEDYTALGGDVEREYVSREEYFEDVQEAFKRFLVLEAEGAENISLHT